MVRAASGLHCVAAQVNGEAVPLRAELKSGECDPRPLAVGSRVLPPLPFAYIVRTNAASEALFTKAGFAPVVQAEWCMLSPT